VSNYITCLLCTVSGPAELVSTTLRDDSSGRFSVVRCLTCGHVQLFPLPSLEEDAAFYEADQQTRRLMGETDFSLWQSKAAADIARRVNWLRSVLPRGNVLDVGCGYGFFVDALAKAGYRATGLDVSRERLALATAHLDGTFYPGEIDETFVVTHHNRFQVVTLFHVLEHVRGPVTFLRQSFELVAPDGSLLIEVPNLSDELLNQQAEYQAFYWQRAHLSYFDAARLELALRRAGFKDFSVRGVQRYGLRNLLHWLDEGKPQLTATSFHTIEPVLVRLEQLYRADRERALTCDTLIAEVRK